MRLILLVATMLGASLFGADELPLLQQALGGKNILDGVRLVKACDVFGTEKYDRKKLIALIEKAEKERFERIGVHIVAANPSKEIWANLPGTEGKPSRKVMLYVDYSDISGRKGAESKELIEIVEELCVGLN